MKKMFFISAISCIAVFYSASAQEQNSVHTKFQVSDVYVQSGMFLLKSTDGTLQDFKSLAPKSDLLTMNLSDYHSSNGFTIDGSTLFSATMGIKIPDKQRTGYRKNPQLRCGISYVNASAFGGGYYKEDRKPCDTLIASQSGNTIYVDSVTSKSVNINYHSQQLRLDASLIYRTNPEKRWSLYSGIGMTAGWALNANTMISYFTMRRTEQTNGSSYSDGDTKIDYMTENFQNQRGGGFSAFIPLGVDFRIGKKREFWQHLHLYYEVRPSVNAIMIPELKTFINAGVQEGLGIRYALN